MNPLLELLHFQLKYCERCGGLWLRPDGAAVPYCPVCAEFMSEMPRRVRKTSQAQKPLSALAATAFAIFAMAVLTGGAA